MQTDESGAVRGPEAPAGVILAGGRSRRMGGGRKSLEPLAGEPMLQHVIDRIAPQVGDLALSVERETAALRRFRLPQLPDCRAGEQGPMGGLLAAMRHFTGRARWLLVVPCDAPFLPRDLAARLLSRAGSTRSKAASARFEGQLQPTFSLWHMELLPELEAFAQVHPHAGLKTLLGIVSAAHCDWGPRRPAAERGGDPPPFFNVNDRADLDRARRWLGERSAASARC